MRPSTQKTGWQRKWEQDRAIGLAAIAARREDRSAGATAKDHLRISLKKGVQLVAVLAVWPERMRCVRRPLGEEGLERLFHKAGAVFAGRPNLIHPEDTSLVEAGAVVERPRGLSEVEEASAERVVIHRVAVVAEVELGDIALCHERPRRPSQQGPRNHTGPGDGLSGGASLRA